MTKIALLIISIALTGCASNASKTVKVVAEDFKRTPSCDTKNVYPHPRDSKTVLAGKLAIVNSKLDECDDVEYRKNEKADNYLENVF